MKTPLLQRCQWSVNSTVIRQLSGHIGISPAKTIWVIDIVLPVMLAAMAKTASHASGTRSLYAAIMSPKVDVHIGRNLTRIFDEPCAADNAVRIGCDRATSFLGGKLPPLANVVAETTGTAPDAIKGVVGAMTVVLFGLIKSHLHASEGQQHALIRLLKDQMNSIQDLVASTYWAVLSHEDIMKFQLKVDERLAFALSDFQQVSPEAPPTDISMIRINDHERHSLKAARSGQRFYSTWINKVKSAKGVVVWQLLPVILLLSSMYGFKHLAAKSPIPITLSAAAVLSLPQSLTR